MLYLPLVLVHTQHKEPDSLSITYSHTQTWDHTYTIAHLGHVYELMDLQRERERQGGSVACECVYVYGGQGFSHLKACGNE